MLSTGDFQAFFEEVHGNAPFPWQQRLLAQVSEAGKWPSVLNLPTGAGKTAAIDVAVFHLALEANRPAARRAPVRIAFTVDRRLVVDDAFTHSKRLELALRNARSGVLAQVADRLKVLADDGPPLIARRLRGGIPREDDWARTPSQPTVLCSTVDQVGSRLLFRGYGVSDSMKPVHAGLLGSDCLILLDEAHLANPFRQTLDWICTYRGSKWRESNVIAPWGAALLTATPGADAEDSFSLNDEDKAHPVLRKRLIAAKPARLIFVKSPRGATPGGFEENEEAHKNRQRDEVRRAAIVVQEIHRALDHFKKARSDKSCPAIGAVLNRVARARNVFEQLKKEMDLSAETVECVLLIGPARPVDRDHIAERLRPVRTGAERTLTQPLILIATQCIEAGVDIDLDALITDVAPLDCLRQRFGRLNRAGRDIEPYGAIVAMPSDLSPRADDPVYGESAKFAWNRLSQVAEKRKNGSLVVDFGIDAYAVPMDAAALTPKEDAPILLPAHLDLLSQTSPIPSADPEISLYLHGASRQPDSVTVVWRADLDANEQPENVRRLLVMVPPRSLEAIELPLWAVRRWLSRADEGVGELADIPTAEVFDDSQPRNRAKALSAFLWKGDDERSRWVDPSSVHAGDTIVVPASHGNLDPFGWKPGSMEPASDVARLAAEAFTGRRFVVRVAPGLMDGAVSAEALADALAGAVSQRWQDLRTAVSALAIPECIHNDLAALDDAINKRSVTAYLDLYGTDEEDRPRGVVFVAPFGLRGRSRAEDGCPNSTEDDLSGSISGFPLSLQQHGEDVEQRTEAFCAGAGLTSAIAQDLKLAGFLHDAGKADLRFQAWLHYGDPLGPDLNDSKNVLAKSGRRLPPAARIRSGLPDLWRHEALSVRLARKHHRLSSAQDPELVLWLIGSHHGYGRPFFPHEDEEDFKLRHLPSVLGLSSELAPDPGPQSLAFDWNGLDWSALFVRLKARYGTWELARMEAIVRLADHRASEARAEGEMA
jgi:CRISPR-associated endonuclease/helicase Cas3